MFTLLLSLLDANQTQTVILVQVMFISLMVNKRVIVYKAMSNVRQLVRLLHSVSL